MAIHCGPVLSFRGELTDQGQTRWALSALLVSDAAETLELQGPGGWQAAGVTRIGASGGRSVWRFDFEVALDEAPSTARYRVAGREFEIALPAAGQMPRMAYTSCNGYSDPKVMKGVKHQNALWARMDDEHRRQPFHLLLCGGDQVYADSMRVRCASMLAWQDLDWKTANKAPFTPAMQAELEAFYFELYCSRWSQPEVAKMLARVPMVAMWDDHDIIDGWGSYPEERQKCRVMKGLGKVATRHFALFQHQLGEGEPHPLALGGRRDFTLAAVVGGVAILALDMRSERTQQQVLGEAHWNRVYDWLRDLPTLDHLFVMSSIPVVYPSFDALERLLGWMPGQQGIEDDLRDHWNSHPHRIERLRFVHHLIEVAERGIRPTLLSGDVHVAAIGHVETQKSRATRDPALIYQFISSGIVHPPPPGVVLFALKNLLEQRDEVEPGIIARMTEFPGTSQRFIGERNFLRIADHDEKHDGRVRIEWIVEKLPTPISKVIHRLEAAP